MDDGVAELDPFGQVTEVPQSDSLSPLLSSVLISYLPNYIKEWNLLVDLLLSVSLGSPPTHKAALPSASTATFKNIWIILNYSRSACGKP